MTGNLFCPDPIISSIVGTTFGLLITAIGSLAIYLMFLLVKDLRRLNKSQTGDCFGEHCGYCHFCQLEDQFRLANETPDDEDY